MHCMGQHGQRNCSAVFYAELRGPARDTAHCAPGRTCGLAKATVCCIPGWTVGPARNTTRCDFGQSGSPAKETARSVPGWSVNPARGTTRSVPGQSSGPARDTALYWQQYYGNAWYWIMSMSRLMYIYKRNKKTLRGEC